jgi:cytochrome bd-type quinol oxidase subunit 1
MSPDNSPAPAGWYPNPDGGQRYWDGTAWLDLPDPEAGGAHKKKIRKKPILIALVIILLAAVGGTVSWKVNHDAQVAAQVAAAEEAANQEAERVAAEKAAQESRDETERASRQLSVAGIESSIEEMANEHVAEGMLDGPVLSVTCSPVNGGSTDNLSETTTVFECFVANEDVGGGRMRGYTYHATMNWTTGKYTYGYGEA